MKVSNRETLVVIVVVDTVDTEFSEGAAVTRANTPVDKDRYTFREGTEEEEEEEAVVATLAW